MTVSSDTLSPLSPLTVAWISAEAVVSLAAAWAAHSPTLLTFGGDSAVELFSAAVVLHRFYPPDNTEAEQRATQIARALRFVLAAFVILASALTLLGRAEARPSPVGMALLILAAVVMPWLARQKRRVCAVTRSTA
jgi:hypothetical protein